MFHEFATAGSTASFFVFCLSSSHSCATRDRRRERTLCSPLQIFDTLTLVVKVVRKFHTQRYEKSLTILPCPNHEALLQSQWILKSRINKSRGDADGLALRRRPCCRDFSLQAGGVKSDSSQLPPRNERDCGGAIQSLGAR